MNQLHLPASRNLGKILFFLLFTLATANPSYAVRFKDQAIDQLRALHLPDHATFDKLDPNAKATQLVEIFSHVRELATPEVSVEIQGEESKAQSQSEIDLYNTSVKDNLIKDMAKAIQEGKPVKLYIVCFPAKSPNHDEHNDKGKTIGDHADLAEEIAVARLRAAVDKMNELYQTELELVSDGRIFGSTWWTNGHEEIVDQYHADMRRMTHGSRILIRDLDSFYPSGTTPAQAREDILKRYAETEEDVIANLEGFKTLKATSGTAEETALQAKFGAAFQNGKVPAHLVHKKFEEEKSKIKTTSEAKLKELMAPFVKAKSEASQEWNAASKLKIPPPPADADSVDLEAHRQRVKTHEGRVATLKTAKDRADEAFRKANEENTKQVNGEQAADIKKLKETWLAAGHYNEKFKDERTQLYMGFKQFISGGRTGKDVPDLPLDHPLRYKKAFDAFMKNETVDGKPLNLDDPFKKFTDALHALYPKYPILSANSGTIEQDAPINSSSLEKLTAKLAIRDIRLSDALNAGAIKNLQEQGYVRLSIRQDLDNAKKVRVALLGGENPPSPWHSAIVIFKDGTYKAIKKREAIKAKYHLACIGSSPHFRPYHYIAEEDGKPYGDLAKAGYEQVQYKPGHPCFVQNDSLLREAVSIPSALSHSHSSHATEAVVDRRESLKSSEEISSGSAPSHHNKEGSTAAGAQQNSSTTQQEGTDIQ